MVEWKKLGEVISVHTGQQLNRNDMTEIGTYPVMNGGRVASGYTDKNNEFANSITISQGGESAGFVNWIDKDFWAGAHCYVVENTAEQNIRYIFHFFKACEYKIMCSKQGAGIPGLSRKNLYSIIIPIPPMAEQERIVGILDTFTASIDNLKAQIEQRRKQYEHYRDSLLDLEGKEGVEMKIEEFCLLKAGKSVSADEISEDYNENYYPCIGGNGIRGYVPFYSHEGEYPIIGRQGALCGCVNWVTGKFYATEHAVVASGNNDINQRFLFYLFENADLNQYKTQGAQPGLSVAKLNEIKFRIPSLEEQERIVSILDNFEESITNLEAQMEQRQKQYEYYRERLLTFE